MAELVFYVSGYMGRPSGVVFVLREIDFTDVCEQFVFSELAIWRKKHINCSDRLSSDRFCTDCIKFNDLIVKLSGKFRMVRSTEECDIDNCFRVRDHEVFDTFHDSFNLSR